MTGSIKKEQLKSTKKPSSDGLFGTLDEEQENGGGDGLFGEVDVTEVVEEEPKKKKKLPAGAVPMFGGGDLFSDAVSNRCI